jgi:hypothetical protein
MKVYAIVGGTTYDLNYGDPAKFEGDDGLGMPDLRRMEERGPFQHGSTDRGYRLEPRYATYVFGIPAQSKSALWTQRQELLQIFRPSRTIIMKHVLDNGEERYLDCLFSGGMNMPAEDRRGGIFQKVGVVLKADDPTYYDPEAQSAMFSIGGGGNDVFKVPFEVPFHMGASTINAAITVVYNGDVPSYPTIRITGPAEDAVLTNETLDLKLDFTGTTIAGGDYYDIDLRYGSKTVVDAAGANQISDLTSDSDIAQWRLETEPDASDGINSLKFTCKSATTATQVALVYYERYLGI